MSRRKRKNNNKFITFIFVIAVICYIFSLYSNQEEAYSNKNVVSSNLQVYFLDVGQADSILITNQDHYMLIDAGNNEDGPKLVKYLKNELGISEFDYVVGTHPHEDHIGGLDDIINNFTIDNFYIPEVMTTTKTFEDVLDALDSKGLEITVPKIGDKFSLGEAEFEVMYTGTDDSDLNNTSIVLKMIFGNYSYLFTGDATNKVEKILLDKNIDVDVLKVGHHGSAYSSSKEFLDKVTPKYAFISVAKENSYGHPSKDTLNRLMNYTRKIYMTSELGTIMIDSDGKKIEVSSFATDTNG